eukprot:318457-Chlamydomonas_euryale.AAC.4
MPLELPAASSRHTQNARTHVCSQNWCVDCLAMGPGGWYAAAPPWHSTARIGGCMKEPGLSEGRSKPACCTWRLQLRQSGISGMIVSFLPTAGGCCQQLCRTVHVLTEVNGKRRRPPPR